MHQGRGVTARLHEGWRNAYYRYITTYIAVVVTIILILKIVDK